MNSRRLAMCRALLAVVVIALSLACATAPAATVVTPGQPTLVNISAYPDAMEFDSGLSKLFVLNRGQNGALLFGSLDTRTGQFSQMSSITADDYVLGISMTVDPGGHRVFLLTEDGILAVDTQGGAMTLYPSPSSYSSDAIAYDGQSNQMFSYSVKHGVQSLDLTSGTETSVVSYENPRSWAQIPIMSTIDSVGHHFFVAVEISSQPYIISISTQDGTLSKVKLPKSIIGMAFDELSGSLYGVTECCESQLVRIDPSTGSMTTVSDLGGQEINFQIGASNTLDSDGNDYFINPTSDEVQQLVSADVSAGRSWYVKTSSGKERRDINNNWMMKAGEAAARCNYNVPPNQISSIVLDFGRPTKNSQGMLGASGFSQKPQEYLTLDDIKSAAENFIGGYYFETDHVVKHKILVVIGTSSNGAEVSGEHGRAWASMVSDINSWIKNNDYSDWIGLVGGIDIEVDAGWAAPSSVMQWVAGYGSNDYANYGDATDCRIGKCDGGWTLDQVYKLSGAYVVPQVYTAGGTQADDWANVSFYGETAYGVPLNIVSPLSQLGACGQLHCSSDDNSPTTARRQMTASLQRKFGKSINLSPAADIMWRVQ